MYDLFDSFDPEATLQFEMDALEQRAALNIDEIMATIQKDGRTLNNAESTPGEKLAAVRNIAAYTIYFMSLHGFHMDGNREMSRAERNEKLFNAFLIGTRQLGPALLADDVPEMMSGFRGAITSCVAHRIASMIEFRPFVFEMYGLSTLALMTLARHEWELQNVRRDLRYYEKATSENSNPAN